jgi:antitoxin (DNA-binding transcriptional repressor) of toxin-antitoxin stability system
LRDSQEHVTCLYWLEELTMPMVEVAKAKNSLPKLVKALESGLETEIILARDGRPAARLIPLAGAEVPPEKRGKPDE